MNECHPPLDTLGTRDQNCQAHVRLNTRAASQVESQVELNLHLLRATRLVLQTISAAALTRPVTHAGSAAYRRLPPRPIIAALINTAQDSESTRPPSLHHPPQYSVVVCFLMPVRDHILVQTRSFAPGVLPLSARTFRLVSCLRIVTGRDIPLCFLSRVTAAFYNDRGRPVWSRRVLLYKIVPRHRRTVAANQDIHSLTQAEYHQQFPYFHQDHTQDNYATSSTSAENQGNEHNHHFAHRSQDPISVAQYHVAPAYHVHQPHTQYQDQVRHLSHALHHTNPHHQSYLTSNRAADPFDTLAPNHPLAPVSCPSSSGHWYTSFNPQERRWSNMSGGWNPVTGRDNHGGGRPPFAPQGGGPMPAQGQAYIPHMGGPGYSFGMAPQFAGYPGMAAYGGGYVAAAPSYYPQHPGAGGGGGMPMAPPPMAQHPMHPGGFQTQQTFSYQPNGAGNLLPRQPQPYPVIDPTMPAAQMTNSSGGVGCEPGYNYFFPAEHTKAHIFKTSTPPWQLPPTAQIPFKATHIPCTTTMADLLKGFGCTNPVAKKNRVFEVIGSGSGKWYKGLAISGDDKDMLKKTLKEVGWDMTRTGNPHEKPIVCLWFCKD
ncbi:hypothetical protein A9K55_001615 [Cordyceps militaris]|uniref:Uncharacterized protein n=1 Tax=Cordyceps militaris TaxID=73501 RepID=A0A2H4SRG0_CORMI|nr:hypothetical protein A9K55_001615 [Cordyceps militaris]